MHSTSVKLSCERCRQRKTKCDKNFPCAACRRAGIECISVHRQRLPRGRSVAKRARTTVLENRIANLETLVKHFRDSAVTSAVSPDGATSSILTDEYNETSTNASVIETTSNGTGEVASPMSQFIAGPFWSALANEVTGLRDVLEAPSDDEFEDSSQEEARFSETGGDANFVLFGYPYTYGSNLLQDPPDYIKKELLSIYATRVDPIFKVGHWPSLHAMLLDYTSYDPTSPKFLAAQALQFAVHFTSVCTLNEHECKQLLFGDKATLLRAYRLAAETALARANLLSSSDITVLQAFIAYLAGLRSCESDRTTWTLVACAIRIASAQGLDTDDVGNWTFFQREIRLRLWHAIGILDWQTAFDRGSTPILCADDFKTLPLNVDDAILSESTNGQISEPASFTDMSFCSMTYEAMNCYRTLNDTLGGLQSRNAGRQLSWDEKFEVFDAFERSLEQRYTQYCDVTRPIQLLTKKVAKEISSTYRLVLRRPMRLYTNGQPPPNDDFDMLETGTEVLECSLQKSTEQELQQWKWLTPNKWFALAVVLAELCNPKERAFTQHAWTVAEDCFTIYAETVADTSSGLLWKPINRLMRKARKVRQEKLNCTITQKQEPTSLGDFNSFYQDPIHQLGQQMDYGLRVHSLQPSSESTIPNGQEWYLSTGNKENSMLTESQLFSDSDTQSWNNWETFVDDIFTAEGDIMSSPYSC